MVFLSRLAWALLCGVAAGLALALAAFPAFALAGLSAKSVSDAFEHLPGQLRIPTSAQASSLYAADGTTLITSFFDENRTDVTLDQISPPMRLAIVAAEDTRFYQHGGVDLKGVVRAAVANSGQGRVAQGASTLTMQYVRNVLKADPDLTPRQRLDATAETPGRKLREIRYATALEGKLTKAEILNRYLNIAYFGAGAYGVEAASQRYFSQPASQLTLAQAALLAGLVQSPDADNPITGDAAAALDRRSYVLSSMVKTGVITTAQADQARAEPVTLHPRTPRNDCTSVPADHNDWGFYCDYFRQWWDAQPAFGATPAERENALRRGGYRVVTALDPRVQAAALDQSLSVYGYTNPRALPMAVVQPGTGRILAMAVNRHYSLEPNPPGQANYPNTVTQLIAGGGGVVGYPAGSTFKMFTMLAALEAGNPLDTGFDAPSRLVTRWRSGGDGNCGGYYCPANATPSWMDGYRTMWNGFGRSVNTYFVWLEQQIGPQRAVDMARRLGITFRADSDARLATTSAASWGSFTLGVADTTPLDLANAYATLAADGVSCRPLPVMSITDASGAPVAAGGPSCTTTLTADVARAATDAARCPVGQESFYGMCDGGTAPEVSDILGGRPVAGKTGSTEDNTTETFVGFTPTLAAAAIAANPDDPRDHVGQAVSASVNAAVARTLAAALHGQPYRDFTAPSPQIAFGDRQP